MLTYLHKENNFTEVRQNLTTVFLSQDLFFRFQVLILCGTHLHLLISKPLNSPPSFCVKYEISSKLEHLPVLVKNCGLKVNRYQYWQLSILTGVKNHKKLLLTLNHHPQFVQSKKFHQNWKICRFWSKTLA